MASAGVLLGPTLRVGTWGFGPCVGPISLTPQVATHLSLGRKYIGLDYYRLTVHRQLGEKKSLSIAVALPPYTTISRPFTIKQHSVSLVLNPASNASTTRCSPRLTRDREERRSVDAIHQFHSAVFPLPPQPHPHPYLSRTIKLITVRDREMLFRTHPLPSGSAGSAGY